MARYHVEADWDSDALVWVARSHEVPGLATEAATVDELVEKLVVMVPELLQLNGINDEEGEILFSARRSEPLEMAA